jgi:hypothetical protein
VTLVGWDPKGFGELNEQATLPPPRGPEPPGELDIGSSEGWRRGRGGVTDFGESLLRTAVTKCPIRWRV